MISNVKGVFMSNDRRFVQKGNWKKLISSTVAVASVVTVSACEAGGSEPAALAQVVLCDGRVSPSGHCGVEMSGPAAGQGAISVRAEFAKHPPQILWTKVAPAEGRYDGRKVRMTVKVADRDLARVGEVLAFYGERGEVFALRDVDTGAEQDAGDGVYTGIVSLSEEALVKEKLRFERLEKSSAKRGETKGEVFVKTFEGRDFVAEEPVEKEEIVDALEVGKSVEVEARGLSATNSARTLLINDLSVVEDPDRTFDLCGEVGNPDGAWTFKTLMTAMANTPVTGISPEVFVRHWLEQFLFDTALDNGEIAEGRPGMSQIIENWEILSGVPSGGPLNLFVSPFRLLAIVNRLDLSENQGYGGNAGEGRFVFGVVDPADPCGVRRFTVILEYGLPLKGCDSVQSYACDWQALDTLPFPSAAYNDALQALTDVFAAPGANPAQSPNQSAINQVRTNDQAFGQDGWEMREFKLDPQNGSGLLFHVGLARQPRHETPEGGPHPLTTNMSGQLDDFMTSEAAAITTETHLVPGFWAGSAFQAASVTYDSTMFFESADPGVDREVRHKLSLNTCSSCHARETDTGFTHVGIRAPGGESPLSGFLTGITVSDPGDPTVSRDFNDLDRRNQKLDLLCNESCSLQFATESTDIVH